MPANSPDGVSFANAYRHRSSGPASPVVTSSAARDFGSVSTCQPVVVLPSNSGSLAVAGGRTGGFAGVFGGPPANAVLPSQARGVSGGRNFGPGTSGASGVFSPETRFWPGLRPTRGTRQ